MLFLSKQHDWLKKFVKRYDFHKKKSKFFAPDSKTIFRPPCSSSNQSLPENKNPRKWHDTTLGCKYGTKEYSQRSGDTVITLMSYNILADCLAAMHPELYTHCKDQGL